MSRWLIFAVLALLCAGAVSAQKRTEAPAASSEVRYVGRTQTNGGDVSFDWSGTSFECRFTGGSLAMRGKTPARRKGIRKETKATNPRRGTTTMEVKHYEGNGRLSVATECNGIIHMTGRTCMPGYYPDIPSGDDVKSQTAGVLKIIDNVLAKYGSDKEHILFAQVFLKDVIRDFDDMNEVWESWVTPGCEPARATVQAKMAKEEALVEIVVTAVRKDA